MYRANEFAQRAGVTVRTLHVYDRMGLLPPSARTGAGYRLYCAGDLERLERILALRSFGFSLERIKSLLFGAARPLLEELAAQERVIAEQRRRLDTIAQTIAAARAAVKEHPNGEHWQAIRTVIEALKMQNDPSWAEQYYTPEALATLAEARERLGSQGMERAQRAWSELITEVERAAREGEDPRSPRGRALAQRWSELLAQFTQGDPEVSRGLKALYADRAAWPDGMSAPYSDTAADFMRRASGGADDEHPLV